MGERHSSGLSLELDNEISSGVEGIASKWFCDDRDMVVSLSSLCAMVPREQQVPGCLEGQGTGGEGVTWDSHPFSGAHEELP